MVDFSEENKESIKRHLTMFYDTVVMEQDINTNVSIDIIADKYISNEMSMQKGMRDYYDHLIEETKKNHRLLNAIKVVKGKTFYKYLMLIIEESEGIKGLAEIVKEPCGTFQKEKYGRQINGIWVEQWSVGMEGDSYNGFVCIELKPNKYLKFGYSM